MDFKLGEYVVFTDTFKEINIVYLKNNKIFNAVYEVKDLDDKYVYVSLGGKVMNGYKKNFRLATENEFKLNLIKRRFKINPKTTIRY